MAKFRENRRISYVMKMSCKVLYKYHCVPSTQTEQFVSNIKMWYKSGSNLISVALCVTTCILTFNYWSISQVSY